MVPKLQSAEEIMSLPEMKSKDGLKDGEYFFCSAVVNAGKFMIDTDGGAKTQRVHIWNDNRGRGYPHENNQKIVIENCGNGVVNLKAAISGLYLSAKGGNSREVICSDQKDEWAIEKKDDGSFIIWHRDTGKVLDIEGASLNNGTKIILYEHHGNSNQRFNIIK